MQASLPVSGGHALTFGGEVYDEYIAADGSFEDPATGVRTVVRPRIPDGTRYTSTGLFAQATTDLVPGRILLRAGARYGHFVFSTKANEGLGIDVERVAVRAATFHTGLVVGLSESVNATLVVSRGFRAPNAFDLGAIGVSGGGFEITTREARARAATLGTSEGSDAMTTGIPVPALQPESGYSVEAGLRVERVRWTGAVRVFDLELLDLMQRRTAIFPESVVGDIIAGRKIVRQDEAGRAYIADDPRPLLTRANVDRARIVGVEGELQVRLTDGWRADGYFSMANGHELDTGAFLRRMPPPIGGARLVWRPDGSRWWAEATATLAFAQTRLSPGDLSDPRIGAERTRLAIADFFDGTASDLGLVADGMLVATGETLRDVQDRVLGDADAAPLFRQTAGFALLGARAGWRLTDGLDLILIVENPTDRNYRWHGSGVGGTGFDVQVRTRFSF